MSVLDQIDRYRQRARIVLAGRRLRGRTPEPPPGAVRLRRDPIGDDAAAADARLASRGRDPRRDPLGAEADQGLRALAADRRGGRRPGRSTTSAGGTSTSTQPSSGRGSPRSTRSPQPTRSAPSTCSTPSARGSAATATRRRATCKEMRRIQRVLPEARFVHIIRDGRDVSLSHLRMNWGPETYEQSARLWRNRIRKARKMAPSIEHYNEVRFEELVADTEGVAAPGLRVHRARLRPGDARLPRARRGAPGREGTRAAAQEPPPAARRRRGWTATGSPRSRRARTGSGCGASG